MIRYLKTKGRINRVELFVLTIIIVTLGSITYLILGKDSGLFLIISILLFVIYLMQCAKRYHDINKWGVNGFVWWIIPIINLIFLFQLYFFKGDNETNKYGAPSTFNFWDLINFQGFVKKNLEKSPTTSPIQRPNPSLTPNAIPTTTQGSDIEDDFEEYFEPTPSPTESRTAYRQSLNTKKNPKVGIFDSEDYSAKSKGNRYFFFKYTKRDGEWVDKNESICVIRIGVINLFSATGMIIKAEIAGVLEWTSKKDDLLKNGQVYYRLHNKGEYQNENIPENSEFREYNIYSEDSYDFVRWIVEDGSFVKIGDPIFRFKESRSTKDDLYFNYAPKEGYIHLVEPWRISGRLEEYELMYFIRENDQIRINERFINKPKLTKDEFKGFTIIEWDQVSSTYPTSQGVKTISDDSNIELVFSFNYIDNTDHIVFRFESKQLKLKQSDKIYFLFENGEQALFELTENPILVKSETDSFLEYKNLITEAELLLFTSSNLIRWKISLTNGRREILGGERGDRFSPYKDRKNLQIVVKKFASEYVELVKEVIPGYQPIQFKQIEDQKPVTAEMCFVYLMYDTSNGYHKIGISNNPEYRERTLQSEKPTIELIISKKFPSRNIAESIEKALHSTFAEKRLRGEWFELNDKDIEDLRETLI